MLKIVALTSSLFMVTTTGGRSDEKAIRKAVSRVFPNASLAGLKLYRSSIPNLYKAELGPQTFHVTADGQHILFGEVSLKRLFAVEKMPI